MKFALLILYLFSLIAFADSTYPKSATKTKIEAESIQYFAEFYSYDGKLGSPASSHTFGQFVKTIGGVIIEKIDISWLPKDEYLRSGGRMPVLGTVPGRNRTFEETQMIAGKKPIINHGIFLIDEGMFKKAQIQKNRLESGKVDYNFLNLTDSDKRVNCIHALLGVVGQIPTGTKSGKEATDAVVKFFLEKGAIRPIGSLSECLEIFKSKELPLHSAREFKARSQSQINLSKDRTTHQEKN